jgi:predicted ATPase/DNA-binding CsgD family transcriptional regulator
MTALSPAVSLSGLPRPRTALVGREPEIAQARDWLLSPEYATPLLTLTGPAGVGKTRLALAIAWELAPHFADGVTFIDLAQLSEPSLLPATVAAALGISAGEDALGDAIVAHLRGRQMLLVLDNCEHLAGPSGQVAAGVLSACPAVQVLATSRIPLRVRVEQVLPVTPLGVDSAGADPAPAVELFLQRARAASPGFSHDQAAEIAGICAMVDGLPLAIELAAARVRTLPPNLLQAGLQQRLPVLTGGPHDLPQRHRTLRDAIGWSYDLLDDDAQRFFRWLAPFAGGLTPEAAATVVSALESHSGCDATAAPSALDLLEMLVEHSLLQVAPDDDGGPRYRMLETIREFALEQLAAEGEEDAAYAVQADWVRQLVARSQQLLQGSTAQAAWATRLDAERGNIRAALHQWLARGDSEAALATAGALVDYWWMRSDFGEGRSWCERALSLAMEVSAPASRASSLYGACVMASNQGDHARALAAGEEMLREAALSGNPVSMIRAHYALCRAARNAGQGPRALEHALAALELSRQAVLPVWQAWVLSFMAEAPDIVGAQRAEEAAHEALGHFRLLQNAWGQANALQVLAIFAWNRGEQIQGATLLSESLACRAELAAPASLMEGLACAADFAARSGEYEGAARLTGAIKAWGGRESSLSHLRLGQTLASVDAHLAPEQVAYLRAEGAASSPATALADARALLQQIIAHGSAAPRPAQPPAPAVIPLMVEKLTPRERDVLPLLGQRLSDAEIAEQLFIGVRTAEFHVSNIMGKLGASSRREAIAIAARMGLL